jgi:hypothetical protein
MPAWSNTESATKTTLKLFAHQPQFPLLSSKEQHFKWAISGVYFVISSRWSSGGDMFVPTWRTFLGSTENLEIKGFNRCLIGEPF